MRPAVVCVGHATVDLVTLLDDPPPPDGRALAREAVLSFGGPAATAAVALARLGIPVAFLGTVGADAAGRLVVEAFEREGVDVSGIRTSADPTATSSIWVDAATGDRRIAAFYRRSGIDELTADDVDVCRSAEWIHLDNPGFRIAPAVRDAGIRTPISVDGGNPIANLDLRLVDLYAPTEARLAVTHPGRVEDAIRAILEAGPRIVVVTRGARGSVGAGRGFTDAVGPVGTGVPADPLEIVEEPGFAVDVVSTLGAGDVFHGALLAGFVRGLGLRDAMRLANAVAALSCRGLDGRSAIPTWGEAEAFLASPVA